jgi:probable phosphoglycerate mutase
VKARLHADGGARGNPGPAGIGAILLDERGEVLAELALPLGISTNNDAEYRALIAGLELAQAHNITELHVFMDSQLVVSQVKGEWKIKKDHLRPLAVRARSLLDGFEKARLSHVPREENADADRLANQAMDLAALDAEQDAESQGSLDL